MAWADSKRASISIIAFCQVMAMALWFSASAIVPALTAEFHLSAFSQAALTSGVQAGFVIGCLASAVFGLADRLDPRRFFAFATMIGAVANLLLLAVDPASPVAIALRVVTGMCMAGIYPVGMKLASTWAKGDMGLMVGILVGALTLGSAAPHLFNAFGGMQWRIPLVAASASAFIAAFLIAFAGVGPNRAPAPRFDPSAALTAWRDVPLRLANLGYLGHMWELYAMWTWVGVYVTAALAARGAQSAGRLGSLAAFVAIGAGALGAVAAGFFADRRGRANVAAWAMMISATCCALTVPAFNAPFGVLLLLVALWGFSVVADSAQFSAIVSETTDDEYVGTALTVQTCLGFLLTMVSIRLTSAAAEWLGWRWAFLLILPGPILGVQAMLALMKPRIREE